MGIHKEGDLREREKRNAQRQGDLRQRTGVAHELLRAGDKEDCVFVVPKQPEVDDDCNQQELLSARPLSRLAH
jgi:hypothetical protein